jgi:hypothetical protein
VKSRRPAPPKDAKPRQYPPPSGLPPMCLPAEKTAEGWGDMVVLNKEPGV